MNRAAHPPTTTTMTRITIHALKPKPTAPHLLPNANTTRPREGSPARELAVPALVSHIFAVIVPQMAPLTGS